MRSHLSPVYKLYRLFGKWSIVLCTILALCSSCEKEPEPTTSLPDWEILTDTAFVQTIKPSTVRLLLDAAGYPQFKDYFKYKTSVYRVEYTSQYADTSLNLSGIICLPSDMPQPWPVLQIYHGLIFADRQAPSSFLLPVNFIGYEFIASVGFAVFIPDLIGYGNTKDLTFPIYNKNLISKASVDMLHAGKEFLQTIDAMHSELFFAGYSLGAYDAVATLEYIQNGNVQTGFQIGGAAIGAGGYNLYQVMKGNIAKAYYPSPAQLIMLLDSYNTINKWERPLSYFFKEEIVIEIPELLSGKYDVDEINQQLPSAYDSIFTPEYLTKIRGDEDTLLVNALKENGVQDWLPNFPTRLYHSEIDEKIPYSDSEELLNNILNKGFSDIELIPINGTNHFNAAADYVEKALGWIQQLAHEEEE